MIIEETRVTEEIGFDLSLRTRSVQTHSRLQQLTPEQLDRIKTNLFMALSAISKYVLENTKKPE